MAHSTTIGGMEEESCSNFSRKSFLRNSEMRKVLEPPMSSEAMGPADRGNRHISEIEVTEFTSDVKCLDDVIGREVRGRGRRRQRTEPETFIPGDSAGQKRRERERESERQRLWTRTDPFKLPAAGGQFCKFRESVIAAVSQAMAANWPPPRMVSVI